MSNKPKEKDVGPFYVTGDVYFGKPIKLDDLDLYVSDLLLINKEEVKEVIEDDKEDS